LPQFGRSRVRRGRGRHKARAPVFAAIDLGTNNCRLLVARLQRSGFRVVDSFSRIVRLGEGLEASGRLSEAAIRRTIKALRVCAGKVRESGARRIPSVATEACRIAVNGGDFLERAQSETGIELEPITAAEEAHLTLAGCAPLLDGPHGHALVFDIGGGSTELTWVELAPGEAPLPLDTLSLPQGVVNLAERYGQDLMAAENYAEIVDLIDAGLAPFDADNAISAAIGRGDVQMLGTSGTVTTMGGLHLDLPRYDRSKVDGLDLEFDCIADITARLVAMDYQDRLALPCIGRGRADLMVAGCAILEAICRRWPVGRLRAADRGIREGLLLAMMADDARAGYDA
jgi:exopolyphosphatase/guanosine-5'-triphosphate,3'-diphosphate pyrophosphatase